MRHQRQGAFGWISDPGGVPGAEFRRRGAVPDTSLRGTGRLRRGGAEPDLAWLLYTSKKRKLISRLLSYK
ncbi:hypothetical protein [Streptomyces albidoflavus]|uniref:hypothetical protein n=1 Tax=Streptomyces albidoflavus TaxID=1886 RepID=UPI0015969B26|nr:hypothetical protein [Streptomyces albidoflavus]